MLNRQVAPPFKSSTSFDLIIPVGVTLSNGLPIQFVSGGAQEVIRVEVTFNAGRWVEVQSGVSHFTASLLTKGTTAKSSFEIAQIFDQYGAHVEVSPGLDIVSVCLYCLTKNLTPVLALFYEVLTSPSFPEKELKQSKSIFLQNLKINNEKTSFLASKLIRRNLFGENHPYGKELEETDVKAIERDQLVKFYTEYFGVTDVIVSGKIDDTSRLHVEETFSAFTYSKSNEKVNFGKAETVKQTYQEKEGSLQSSIRLGKSSLLRSHPDYADVLFLNHILGGYFGSRLMKNIREEKGLSYGIYSSIHALMHDSYVVIGADVNKENRELATEEIKKEIRKLRVEKIDAHELQTAKYHFIGSLQSEITTPFAHADKLKNILLHNLDSNYYQNLINRISMISVDELMTTAEKYFQEESFLEVAVG